MKFIAVFSALVGLAAAGRGFWGGNRGGRDWRDDECDLEPFFCRKIDNFYEDFCERHKPENDIERRLCKLSRRALNKNCPRRFRKREADAEAEAMALAAPEANPGRWNDRRRGGWKREHYECGWNKKQCRKAEELEDELCDTNSHYYSRLACYVVSHATHAICPNNKW